MKKLLSVAFACLYLAVTTGFTVRVDYCMGEVASVEMGQGTTACAMCGKMAGTGMSRSCCSSVSRFYKDGTAHMSAPAQAFHPFLFAAAIFRDGRMPAVPAATLPPCAKAHAPPGQPDRPVRLLHCVWLI